MKMIEVPVFNDDGSVKIVQQVSAQEAQHLLQFAINFLSSLGLSAAAVAGEAEQAPPNSTLN